MSCIIQLDASQGQQHYPGGILEGRVICSFSNTEEIREIRVKLRGDEHNSWRESESYYDSRTKKTKRRMVSYSGNHQFLALQTSLLGPVVYRRINPGRHEYQFSFTLPTNLPGTYQGKYGWVKYSVTATVDIPFAIDYEDSSEFRVVAPVDLNTMIDYLNLEPVSYSDDKMVCCFCCASGPITMNVYLEKEAFVPGEAVNVKVDITNLSNESIRSLNVKMGMTVTSKVTSPRHRSKNDHELLATYNDTGVGAHGERTYRFQLEIPDSTVVPNFNLCTLFTQSATISVTGVLPDCHNDLTITNNVVMGTIPVRGRFQNVSLQVNTSPHPIQENNQVPTGGASYSESPPPSYASVITSPGGGKIESGSSQPPTGGPIAFPSLPPGGLLPNPASLSSPNDPPGPSAPPMEGAASAPTLAQLAEEENFEVALAPNSSSVGDPSGLLPPPSYNEAVSETFNTPVTPTTSSI